MSNQQSIQHSTAVRIAPLAAAIALLGAACGSTTTASSPVDAEPVAASDTTPVIPTTTDAPRAAEAPPMTDAPPTTDSPPTTDAPGPAAVCGDFGPIPPTPDSMATEFFDTNGDAEPDFVTAYAGHGHPWTLRVVEDGITSEALIPGVLNYAGLIGAAEVETRDQPQVRDNDTGTVWTYATNADGCVELVNTEPGVDPDPTDDLVLTTPTVPAPTVPLPPVTIKPVLVAPPAPTPCGAFDPIPAESQITADLSVDLDDDGIANDQVISYLDGDFKLRTVRNGIISELDIPDVGVATVRALGVGNIGEISAGNEIVARTGAGASSVGISIFGHDADGCLFTFTRYGDPLEMFIGATVGNSAGASCGESFIAQWEYSLDDDGTYFGSSAAWFESTPGDFTYLPASDDFSEGLTLDELTPAELQCFGFEL